MRYTSRHLWAMQNHGLPHAGAERILILHTQPQATGDDDTKLDKKAAAVCGTEPEVLSRV